MVPLARRRILVCQRNDRPIAGTRRSARERGPLRVKIASLAALVTSIAVGVVYLGPGEQGSDRAETRSDHLLEQIARSLSETIAPGTASDVETRDVRAAPDQVLGRPESAGGLDPEVDSKLRIERNLRLNGLVDVAIDVQPGMVRLTGSVSSRADLARALLIARRVDAPLRVISDLKVLEHKAVQD